MAFDAHKNFAFGHVAIAPIPADSGTTLTLITGDAAKMPAVPFNVTVYPAGVRPNTSNAEVMRVTNISTDTLTVVRAQEGTGGRIILPGDEFTASITAKTVTDIENLVNANTALVATAIQPSTGFVGSLVFSSAVSQIVPGATSFSIRNPANTFDNFIVGPGGGIGIGGVFSDNNAITITSLAGTTTLGNILAEKRALSIVMTTNWSDLSNGQFYDLIDIQHKSAGDAIFIAHLGGLKPGGSLVSGADAALNVLIPYYRDDIGTGRGGTVVNTYTGMNGLVIGAQPTTAHTALSVAYWGTTQGLSIQNQFPNAGANPQGNGSMFWMQQYGTGNMIKIDHHESTTSATFAVVTYDDASGSRHFVNLSIAGEANQRFQITYTGTISWGQNGSAAPDASLKYGTSAKQLTMSNELKIQQGSGLSGSRTFSIFTTGDATLGFQILGTGKMQWSDRTAAFDTDLYRNGVNTLKTDGIFQVGGLLQTVASASGSAGFNLPHGAAPSAPVDGDMWTTSAGGLFVRINGVTKTVTLT